MELLPDNTFAADPALQSALRARLGPDVLEWAEPQLFQVGALAAHEIRQWGDECERQPAWLRSFDPWGDRVDEVVYPEAWGKLAATAAATGCTGLPYEESALRIAGPDVRVVHAALSYLFEPGAATYYCPVAMTDAAARVLAEFGPDDLRKQWFGHLVSRDPAQAWTAGQWMTEQQGGSDVGANEVSARLEGGLWKLYGRKFFCSNVGGEMVLALARPEGGGPGTRGLGLFLIPRLLPDAARNSFRIDRLKDKLGTRAMATGEVTLDGAQAELVGSLEHGFSQMTPMLNITRFHNAVSSAASMRRGLMLARGYASQRSAFGRLLEDQPLHRQVLVELAVDAEACLLLTLRLAELLGRAEQKVATEQEANVFRLGTSLTKLYTAKRAVAAASEAIEAFGGQGYMEDTGLPRLLRDSQVLPIWEGTTNVLSLDALRVLAKPGIAESYLAELERLDSPGRDAAAASLAAVAGQEPDLAQSAARRLAYQLSEAWIAGLLREAAAQGPREARVAELWQAYDRVVPGDLGRVVDGERERQPATR
jgi:alkylation response protein AidB-like acyl-CoA dehydrogenase